MSTENLVLIHSYNNEINLVQTSNHRTKILVINEEGDLISQMSFSPLISTFCPLEYLSPVEMEKNVKRLEDAYGLKLNDQL